MTKCAGLGGRLEISNGRHQRNKWVGDVANNTRQMWQQFENPLTLDSPGLVKPYLKGDLVLQVHFFVGRTTSRVRSRRTTHGPPTFFPGAPARHLDKSRPPSRKYSQRALVAGSKPRWTNDVRRRLAFLSADPPHAGPKERKGTGRAVRACRGSSADIARLNVQDGWGMRANRDVPNAKDSSSRNMGL